MNERRQLERFELKVPAAIESFNQRHKGKELNLLTSDICSGGAYFHTAEPLPEGTKVKIDLVLPLDKLRALKKEDKKAYIKVTGKVLRSESGGMAIGFDGDYQIAGSINEE
jgi:hypothetical protein